MAAAGIKYTEYLPCPALRGQVECYWSRVSPSGAPPAKTADLHRVLPDGCSDIVFNFGDDSARRDAAGRVTQVERAAVVGTMSRPLLVRSAGRVHFVGVRFKPGKAHAFVKVCAAELTDRSVALDDVWGRTGKTLEAKLRELGDVRQQIASLEKDLLGKRAPDPPQDPYFDALIDFILRHRGDVSVASLSSFAGLSRQHLARKFDRYVGISPKLFCRVVRFRSLLKDIDRPQRPNWSAAALDLGYYDQAHMISDFREFSGLAPTAFLALR